MNQAEHKEQAALFDWLNLASVQYPEFKMAYAIPNGGHRYISVAKKLKREGVKPGVPDICFPVARDGYHALYIELKAGNNKPTKKQQQWIIDLSKEGNLALVCIGWEQAKNVFIEYIQGKK